MKNIPCKVIRKLFSVIGVGAMFMFGCSHEPLETVEVLDVRQYEGKWYEIARLPNRFEKGLKCVTANYTLREDGKVKVVNKGIKEGGEEDSAEGVAMMPNMSKPGELKVTFFWPFYGNYFVIELDEEYRWTMVGDPSRDYLWILSREQSIPDSVYNQYLSNAKSKGFDVDKLVRVEQNCD
jgi:apolipoprotein D and lipocalin family protein